MAVNIAANSTTDDEGNDEVKAVEYESIGDIGAV